MHVTVDHVVFAWDDLDYLTDLFADLGLTPTYGGTHGNGETHMSLLTFPDGSYIELIAPLDEAAPSLWSSHMTDRNGPCAWCIDVDDIQNSVKSAIDAGVAVAGPWNESRHRPDGTFVEWDMAFLDVKQNSADQRSQLLPFVLSDRTPRQRRVRYSDEAPSNILAGIGAVVLVVSALDSAIDRLRGLFQLPTPEVTEVNSIDARIAQFPGTPVALASPIDDGTWLADRLASVGPGPCTYLIESNDIDAAATSYPLTDIIEWPIGRVAWFDDNVFGKTLGVIGSSK